jgi:hypothetical protein
MAYTTINKPNQYFNTVLYTGNGASPRSITGVGFKPDFVWSKSRSTAENHNLYDAVRGGTQGLRSNLNNAETSSSIYGYVSTFNSDGVTYISGGTNNDLNNGSGVTFVNWNWLGANTTVSNTSGSITSTVSANPTAGFSIVSYTGTGANATVGHGLGVAPDMIICKSRTQAQNWAVYHTSLGNTKAIFLDGTSVGTSASYWNNTSPTSTVFTVGNSGDVNYSAGTQISYCFSSIKGYSKFGSYVGNGVSDGPFIYTGFKPAFVMVKNVNSGKTESWAMWDNKRSSSSGNNVINLYLTPNLSDAESSTTVCDLISNGFKFRFGPEGRYNQTDTFIYMAFAENPFVSSTFIPTTAR